MELLNTKESTLALSFIEPDSPLLLDNAQVQPLTPLMEEIITFQQNERALFSTVELSTTYLN
jgi:hypothetical protein